MACKDGGPGAFYQLEMSVSKNNGTPKSSILIGFSIINRPFWGIPIFGNTQMKHQQIFLMIFSYADDVSFDS